MSDSRLPFLRRVRLRNYKSIPDCDVELGQLMLLVGPNGSGKSNFLDAIRFVAESLRTTLDQALRERGGIQEVRRRSRGHPTHFSIGLDISIPKWATSASYDFRVGSQKSGGYAVQEELCEIHTGGKTHSYEVREGKVVHATFTPPPPASSDRLYLTLASGFPEFRVVYDFLSGMGFYSISPEQLRDLQEPDAGTLLLRDGRNAASVIAWLAQHKPAVKRRIEEYLEQIAPGVKQVERVALGHKEALEFRQTVAGDEHPWSFPARSMSDGTLRALGVLVALFQCFDRPETHPIPLVGIEEPESTLHPAAAGVLLDALREAADYTQVLVTSHSPELLDNKELDPESLLIVDAARGITQVAPADEASKSAIRDRLYSAGELLKMSQLHPAIPVPAAANDEMPLFPNEA